MLPTYLPELNKSDACFPYSPNAFLNRIIAHSILALVSDTLGALQDGVPHIEFLLFTVEVSTLLRNTTEQFELVCF